MSPQVKATLQAFSEYFHEFEDAEDFNYGPIQMCYEIDQEREELHNLRLTIDDHMELLEEIKSNCFDISLEHTLLMNGCAELKAEQELKKINKA